MDTRVNLLEQLKKVLDRLPNCQTSPNGTGFTINHRDGVKWGKTARKKKWGQAFRDENRFYCGIDFEVERFDLDELSRRLNLPIREEGEERSGIRKRICPEYDTVQISLYDDATADSFNFSDEAFIDWLKEVARVNGRR